MPYGLRPLYADRDPDAYNKFIKTLACFAQWLANNDHTINLFCTDIGVDPSAVADLRRTLHDVNVTPEVPSVPSSFSTEELLANMAEMDYVVTCRYHGVVFACLLNVPVLAMSHHPKVATLMADLGLDRYCVDIHADTRTLKRAFAALMRNRADVKTQMARTVAQYQNKLVSQFDDLFPPYASILRDAGMKPGHNSEQTRKKAVAL
jgi:polysaccharide pyruvyl transferase WcaK-like protein